MVYVGRPATSPGIAPEIPRWAIARCKSRWISVTLGTVSFLAGLRSCALAGPSRREPAPYTVFEAGS